MLKIDYSGSYPVGVGEMANLHGSLAKSNAGERGCNRVNTHLGEKFYKTL